MDLWEKEYGQALGHAGEAVMNAGGALWELMLGDHTKNVAPDDRGDRLAPPVLSQHAPGNADAR